MLSHNSQQQLPNSNENRFRTNKRMDQYNGNIDNRTRTLTTLSPSKTHPNIANRSQCMLHSTAETTNTYGKNDHLTNCTYQGAQNRRHTYHTTPFRSSNAAHDQQCFHHKGSPKSSNLFYRTYLCKDTNNVIHNSNKTVSNLETSSHAKSSIYEGNLLSSVMIDQTIIQAALSSIEICDGTKSKFEAWTQSIENATQILGQSTTCIAFSKLSGSPLSTANKLKA